jgi:hypothetical protein
MFSKLFSRNRAVYEITWKNMLRTRQATDDRVRRMRIACWITKATYTLKMCNTYCFSTVTVVTRTRLSMLYVHCLSDISR